MARNDSSRPSQELLDAIQDAFIRKNAGEDPQANPTPRARIIPSANPNDLAVAPAKPDPEAVANSQIAGAAKLGATGALTGPAGYQVPPASNGINPDTGMPFYSPQSQMSDDDKAKLQLKMQYLQNLQNTGGSSGQQGQ
jgi:hypothetical protein